LQIVGDDMGIVPYDHKPIFVVGAAPYEGKLQNNQVIARPFRAVAIPEITGGFPRSRCSLGMTNGCVGQAGRRGRRPYEGKHLLPLPLGEVAERQRGRRGFTRRDQGLPIRRETPKQLGHCETLQGRGNPRNNREIPTVALLPRNDILGTAAPLYIYNCIFLARGL